MGRNINFNRIRFPSVYVYCYKKAMKKITFILLLAILAACGQYPIDEEENNTESYPVTFNFVNEKDSQITYPLSLFIFNHETQKTEQKEITENDLPFQLSLQQTDYTLTLCSGLTEGTYNVFSDSISLPQAGYATFPLLMGSADVHPDKETDIKLTLNPTVASLYFTLLSLPETAESVTLHVSPVSSSVSFSGNYKNDNRMCSVECQKNGDTWTAGTIYVFPSESTRTRLSIEVKTATDTKVYNYTYKQALQEGQPYRFTGSFEDGISLEGKFEITGWQPAIDVEFTLDETTENKDEQTPDTGEEDDLETFYATQLPESESIWGNFYVWKTDTVTVGEEVIATLISPDQWYVYAEDAPATLAGYQEDVLGNWRMFTSDEAKAFRDQYGGDIDGFNDFVEAYGIYGLKKDGRYLCCNADSTFSFSNNRIIKVGKTVKYYLRGIKKIRLIQK